MTEHAKPTPPDSAFDAEAHIQALAPAVGLTLDAESRARVAVFLTIAKGMAECLETLPPHEVEPSKDTDHV